MKGAGSVDTVLGLCWFLFAFARLIASSPSLNTVQCGIMLRSHQVRTKEPKALAETHQALRTVVEPLHRHRGAMQFQIHAYDQLILHHDCINSSLEMMVHDGLTAAASSNRPSPSLVSTAS